MSDIVPTFQVGDRVYLKPDVIDPGYRTAWNGEATVHVPVYYPKPSGFGQTEETTHAVGIRFDGYPYTSDSDCHTVANNQIYLALDQAQVDAAIESIKEAAHGH